jgi:hypothetical protein
MPFTTCEAHNAAGALAARFAAILPSVPASARATATGRWHFDSLAAAMDALPQSAPPGAWHASAWSNSHLPAWHGATWSEVQRYAAEGWIEGAEAARRIRDGIQAQMPTAPRLIRWDVAGALPSIPRALAGNPLNMRRMAASVRRTMPTVTLVSNMSTSSSVQPAELIDTAAALAALVDVLEESGLRCEVIGWAPFVCAYGSTFADLAILAKAPDQPLDLASIAFSAGHAAAYRRLGFACVAMAARARGLGDSLGRGGWTPAADSIPPGTFLMPTAQALSGRHGAKTPIARFIAMCVQLRAQGCPGIPAAEDMPRAA